VYFRQHSSLHTRSTVFFFVQTVFFAARQWRSYTSISPHIFIILTANSYGPERFRVGGRGFAPPRNISIMRL